MTEAFSKNFIDYEEYPQSAEIQNRCVSMIARLFNIRKCCLALNLASAILFAKITADDTLSNSR